MPELKLSNDEVRGLLEIEAVEFEKYVSPLINLANTFAQGTRPHVVGQLTELINEFGGSEFAEWEKFYLDKYGDRLDKAKERITSMLKKMKKAFNNITEADIEKWVADLVIAKTFIGLRLQETILITVAQKEGKNTRRASVDEEAKGIDGYIGDEPVSIKPHTYDAKVLPEGIKVRLITYRKTKGGVLITY